MERRREEEFVMEQTSTANMTRFSEEARSLLSTPAPMTSFVACEAAGESVVLLHELVDEFVGLLPLRGWALGVGVESINYRLNSSFFRRFLNACPIFGTLGRISVWI